MKKIFVTIGISKKLASNIGILFIANLSNNGVAFLINMLIARSFSHAEYGEFAIATNIAVTLQTIAELGINLSMVRLYKERQNDSTKSSALILWSLIFKISEITLIFLVWHFFQDPIVSLLTSESSNKTILYYAVATAGFLLIWEFLKALFQAKENFKKIGTLTLLYSLFRAALIISLYHADSPDINNIFIATYIAPLAPLLIYGLFTSLRSIELNNHSIYLIKRVEVEYLNYSKWIALGGISFTVSQSAMIFMTSHFRDLKSVSLISAGLVFTTIFNLFNTSATQVLFPKVSSLKINDIAIYRNKLYKILPIMLLTGLTLIGVFSSIMYFILGSKYQEALPIFWITGVNNILVTWLGFYSIVLHSIKRPDIAGRISFISMLLFIIGAYFILSNPSLGIISLVSYYAATTLFFELLKRAFISKTLRSLSSPATSLIDH